MAETTTVRVPAKTRDLLNDLARRRGTPAGQLVDELVREADDRALLAAALVDWNRLAEDIDAIAAYRGETAELESFDAPLPEY